MTQLYSCVHIPSKSTHSQISSKSTQSLYTITSSFAFFCADLTGQRIIISEPQRNLRDVLTVIKFVKSAPMHEQVGFLRLIKATLLDTFAESNKNQQNLHENDGQFNLNGKNSFRTFRYACTTYKRQLKLNYFCSIMPLLLLCL